jgi:glutamine cyclotransferase
MTRTSKPATAGLRRFLWLLVLIVWAGCRASGPSGAQGSPAVALPPPPGDGLPVLVDPPPDSSLPHTPEDFTQGLLFSQGALFESTGRNGESKLRRLNADSGAIEETRHLPEQYFGEGLASFQDRLYQLTWISGVCLVYDQKTLTQRQQLFYPGQGWGLTVSPEEKLLVFSDGTARLKFLDPENFVVRRTLTVQDGQGRPVENLNELEWVEGEVWANVWMTDRIARIDPQSGQVKSWLLLTELTRTHHDESEDVLNGIAYDPVSDRLWVTGKLWEKIYRFDNVRERFFAPDSDG